MLCSADNFRRSNSNNLYGRAIGIDIVVALIASGESPIFDREFVAHIGTMARFALYANNI
jgi:hypothetical protein